MTTKRMIIMLVLALLLFGGVFGMKYMGKKGMNEMFDSMPIPAATISAGPAKAMTWDNRLEANGTLVAVNGTNVTTEAGGIVMAIHFESGAEVKKGARLLTLDAANETGEMERLKAQAELSKLNLARREKLLKLEAISKSDFDTAQAEYNAAAASIAAQQALLAQKDIRAPFNGQLGIRQVNVGQYVAPGTPIVSLQSVDPIEFDFTLPEQHLAQVLSGQKVLVAIDAYPGTEFGGAVTAVEPRIDESTRSFRVRARLPNPDHRLHAGQFGRVKLALPGERNILAIPRTAVSYSSYGTSVFVIQKKKPAPAAEGAKAPAPPPAAPGAPGAPAAPELEVVQRFIRVGEARGDFVAVLEGLKPDEQVATTGLLKLRNQQPVVIDNRLVPDAQLNPMPSDS
ncbi:MAG: efflux RND transporter periplasmic adaptor subunit [Panacagrimonas sp.]